MTRTLADERWTAVTAHRGLCLLGALAAAAALRSGNAAWLLCAAFAFASSLALALSGPPARQVLGPPRPTYHAYVRRRLGSPADPGRFAWNLLVRPLLAPTFARFWWSWNPPYAWVLRCFVYAPLRRVLARRPALFLTFLASGLLLHDLPFNFTAAWARGETPVPSVTVLFGILGALTLASEALRIDLSRSPPVVRATTNLAWIAAAFACHSAFEAVALA